MFPLNTFCIVKGLCLSIGETRSWGDVAQEDVRSAMRFRVWEALSANPDLSTCPLLKPWTHQLKCAPWEASCIRTTRSLMPSSLPEASRGNKSGFGPIWTQNMLIKKKITTQHLMRFPAKRKASELSLPPSPLVLASSRAHVLWPSFVWSTALCVSASGSWIAPPGNSVAKLFK